MNDIEEALRIAELLKNKRAYTKSNKKKRKDVVISYIYFDTSKKQFMAHCWVEDEGKNRILPISKIYTLEEWKQKFEADKEVLEE
ncbi:MAG: hypothetical protein ACI4WW_02755 [Candidatus Coprovivens sp.]